MTNIIKIALAIVVTAAASVLGAFIIAIPILLSWNYLMPAVFGLKEINLYQAVVMGIFSSLLFKNWDLGK